MQLLLVMVIFIAITIVELQKQHVEKTFLDFCVILLEKGNDVHVEANGHHLFQNRDGHHHDGKQLHRWRVYLRRNHRNVICWLATSDCNEISVNTWKNTFFFDLRHVLSEYFRCLVVQGDGSRGCYRIAFMHASIGVLAWPSNIVVFIDLLKNLPGLHKEKNATGTKTKMSQVSSPSSLMDRPCVWNCSIHQLRFNTSSGNAKSACNTRYAFSITWLFLTFLIAQNLLFWFVVQGTVIEMHFPLWSLFCYDSELTDLDITSIKQWCKWIV